jgi:exosortase/archaeosortase family protein
MANLGARFALTFAVIAALLFSIYAFPFELFGAEHDWLEGYLELFARLAGGALRLVDHGVSVSGTLISGRYPLQIVRNCDAAEINILFGSAVLAFPAPARHKALSLVAGLGLLVAANVLRICCLYFIGVYRASWFKVAHEEVWPLILVGLAAFSFLRAARYLEGKRAKSA